MLEIQEKIENLGNQIVGIRENNNSSEEVQIQSRPLLEEMQRLIRQGRLLSSEKNNNGVYDLEGLAEIFIESGSDKGKYVTVVILSIDRTRFCLKNSPWIIGRESPLSLAIKKTPVGGISNYTCKSRSSGRTVRNTVRIIKKSVGLAMEK